ncbi:MAG: DUF3376 domain-containing protein, partial [Actinomycetota bacterium]|nr:DUF3376 domain-containing protein [Actinomycetota bacterium]
AAAVGALLAGPLQAAEDGIAEALRGTPGLEDWTRRLLGAYDERFETFDMVVLPLAYPDLGEVNAAEIRRISPRDAPAITPSSVGKNPVDKLAGIQVQHFGAFLESSWRVNDMMWGRLDAAEAILDALLPDHAGLGKLGERLRVSAQAAILRDCLKHNQLTAELAAALAAELAAPRSDEADDALVTAFLERYERPPDLTPARKETLAGRSLEIAGQVLAESAPRHRLPRWPLALLGHMGPTIVRLAGWRARVKRWRARARHSLARLLRVGA